MSLDVAFAFSYISVWVEELCRWECKFRRMCEFWERLCRSGGSKYDLGIMVNVTAVSAPIQHQIRIYRYSNKYNSVV